MHECHKVMSLIRSAEILYKDVRLVANSAAVLVHNDPWPVARFKRILQTATVNEYSNNDRR